MYATGMNIKVKETNIFKVPEVPKKAVPEEKVPIPKKEEPPTPKGIYHLWFNHDGKPNVLFFDQFTIF